MKNILDIQPFNDIFYKSCYYNPLLSAIYYYEGNILPFLSNDLFLYEFEENSSTKITVKNLTVIPETEIFHQLGIYFKELDENEITSDIKKSIENGAPVFIPIDRYYWSSLRLNSFLYKKQHMGHYFLIFGYDDQENTYDIIDIATSGECCHKSKIDISELVECYKGYISYFNNYKTKASSIIYNPQDRNNQILLKNKFRLDAFENYINYKSIIYNSIESISKTISFFSTQNNPSFLLLESLLPISQSIFFIDIAKKVEMYKNYNLFDNYNKINSVIREIASNFSIVKGLMMKTAASEVLNNKTIDSIVARLQKIYDLEIMKENITFSIIEGKF